ncbi:ABC transporter ATP-binding protein [Carnobacteriaceae bacterium zg-ZUI78]|uniref:ABC transporter ATP-binding protein n=1 Tax=Granulicatella sp. zg-84 TaxID=2678503 RepID=UPI0013C16A22|nr:ABC transporter ATP-binding protein [Granulicatella sp. zg-84]MBS4750876.1 ABC transporter ATP-binding protein [Carnobacteriaceae bacterium zg-ZUI78]NEW65557.1 putative bacteriocin export ABC transporter [Granulicatella sp. zg-84]QMI86690.1 ABC transporter ATP-binding protein [Carnobacteriaceae bacterium zg-84]
MIKLNHLTKTFKHKTIFDSFSLKIQKGEMVAIIGKSGSGKTTLLNMIGLIEEIDSGTYFLNGNKAPKPNTKQATQIIREQISYLFQNFALVDYLTVEHNLMMALKYVKLSLNEKKKIIHEALEKVGLLDYESLKIFEISGGEQQRVAIARAMIKPSTIILADEPTGSLDDENRDDVLTILRELNHLGKTVIIVTHDSVVAKACDRVITLDSLPY